LVLAALIANVAFAAGEVVVDRGFVQEAFRRGAVVWDVRPAAEYAKGHIPGAVNIDDAARVLRDPRTADFIPVRAVEQVLGAAGLDPRREIVAYGTRGAWNPYFAAYAVQYFGGTQARVYHDGIEDWVEAGLALERSPTRLAPVALELSPAPGVAVTTEDVLARLGRADVQIVDARTPEEYLGQDVRSLRGGHIPGAVNIPYERNWIDPEAAQKLWRREVAGTGGMALKPMPELQRLYSRLDPRRETIVYCQTGVRAAQTAAVLRHLGFRNVKLYDSSWLAYGNRFDAPAENVTFFDVGAVNARLAAMQARIEQLEKELVAARGRQK
jgi:thiosulfate/3-mercaptopyruvate sulfurtransferase